MIRALSAGYRDCPQEVRERLATRFGDGIARPGELCRRFDGTVVLSTCNRFEIYVSDGFGEVVAGPETLGRVLALNPGGEAVGVRELEAGEAVEHLFRVVCGLESMVLGESEILGQVRGAYSKAVEAGTVDTVLSRLFHEALRVGRRAREQTGIGREPVSVPAIAARAARDELGSLRGRQALVIGTGEAGLLAARMLVALGADPPTIASHSRQRADAVVSAVRGCGITIEEVEGVLPLVDVIMTATGRGGPLVTRDLVCRSQAARNSRPAVIIDLSSPRDVDPGVAAVPGITLIGLDDLQDVAARSRRLRWGEVEAVESLVVEARREFERWVASRAVIPSIAALTSWAESVRQRQLERAFRGRNLDEGERGTMEPVLEEFSRALVKQLIRPLIVAMRDEIGGRANARALTTILGIESRAQL